VFLCEPRKIQIQDENPPESLNNSQILSVARSYLETLDYIRFSAVGMNIVGFIQEDDAPKFLSDKFLKTGPWVSDNLGNTAIRFNYSFPEIILNLTIDSGSFSPANSEHQQQGIVINGNYHKNIPSGLSLPASRNEADNTVANSLQHYNHFIEILGSFFELEA